ncbi:MAG TPA: hypothetical protein P5234_06165 [Thermoanaerobaculaceae bacterium]|nr:hypothetical protein [Thermoanaerobaculaceae bacterium]HRS15822.1 hypothetical protein [Thermoanaerobaculaceae bacterium]
MARFLMGESAMMVPPTAALASRFLEPLTHPWAAVVASLTGGGPAWNDASFEAVRVAWRLLQLLLSL